MRLRPTRRFSALLLPGGLHIVEYRRGRNGISVVRSHSAPLGRATAEEAVERLADLLEAEGARDGALAVTWAGMGSYHHVLTLPRASAEVLRPVIQREVRRFYPTLFATAVEPVIEFVPIDSQGEARHPDQGELLVAGMPRELVDRLHSALEARGIALEHLTVIPRALQAISERFIGPEETAALLLLVPGTPLLGFFHGGELRYFSEALIGEPLESQLQLADVAEQLERGALFLRQQFRGAAVQRVLVAGEPDEVEELRRHLAGRLPVPLERISPHGNAPAALAALGAAVAAEVGDPINLLPAAARRASPVDLWTRRLGVLSAALVVLAAAAWAGGAIQTRERAEQRLVMLEGALRDRAGLLHSVQPVIAERQAHQQRARLLDALVSERGKLRAVLWTLQEAPRSVQVDSLRLSRSGDGWAGLLHGTARSTRSADASGRVRALHQELAKLLPQGEVQLKQMAYVNSPAEDSTSLDVADAIAITFEIAFIVPVTGADN